MFTASNTDDSSNFYALRMKALSLQLKRRKIKKLPFLNVLTTKMSNNEITVNYKKSTGSDLLTHY